jgi:MFS family permease
MRGWLTKTVLILSVVSFLNDMAGELLYPVLPLYMAGIGFGALWIGILEGVAEAVSGLAKGWFGEWSDKKGVRLPFVRFGYLLSALSKPLIALFSFAPWAVLMRTGDRLGKGVRTGARDALLADETEPKVRGKVYGFHRAMDTLGAVAGPCIALWWLNAHRDVSYKPLFLYALFPGLLAVALLFLIREKRKSTGAGIPRSPFSSLKYWKRATSEYRKLVIGILIFTVFNSSDMFLLLLVKKTFAEDITFGKISVSPDMFVVGLYIFYNIIYAVFSWPAGWLSDKLGAKKLMLAGLFFFALAYGGMTLVAFGSGSGIGFIATCFFIYGLFSACTDGVSKAWLSRLSSKEEKATSLGLFAALASLGTLVASVLAGALWVSAGPVAVFILPAAAAITSIIYLTFQVKSPSE